MGEHDGAKRSFSTAELRRLIEDSKKRVKRNRRALYKQRGRRDPDLMWMRSPDAAVAVLKDLCKEEQRAHQARWLLALNLIHQGVVGKEAVARAFGVRESTVKRRYGAYRQAVTRGQGPSDDDEAPLDLPA